MVFAGAMPRISLTSNEDGTFTIVQDGRAVARVPAVMVVDGREIDAHDPAVLCDERMELWLRAASTWWRENRGRTDG